MIHATIAPDHFAILLSGLSRKPAPSPNYAKANVLLFFNCRGVFLRKTGCALRARKGKQRATRAGTFARAA